MINIKKLEKELTITPKDWDSVSKKTKDQLCFGAHVEIAFSSDYAFDCKCCENAAPHLNPYQILKINKYIKGNLECLSEILSLVDLKNIFRIKKDKEPEYNSYLNHVEGVGVVCDHCFESVYSDE